MNMANSDIRMEAKKSGVALWMIAEEIGVSEATMTRRMRCELCNTDKQQMQAVIERIAERRAAKGENADH